MVLPVGGLVFNDAAGIIILDGTGNGVFRSGLEVHAKAIEGAVLGDGGISTVGICGGIAGDKNTAFDQSALVIRLSVGIRTISSVPTWIPSIK